ncbi:MAG: aminotransferase class III-fold pyridoxal phosphate-dependent enzyme [Actinomycetia bacterium]|nr:aminotransferase class III-fold pyridoxal phosphate-dependent enzyme [Actinomycetes bacterium]
MSRGHETNADWHERASGLTPAGVHSNARIAGAETIFTRGAGPWLFDVEGNRYVDYMLGRGPAVLGHTPTMVNEAVARAVAEGLTLGQATPLEVEAAEAVLSVIPWADRLRFTSSGTEAVQAAFRLARAATGRPLIVQFEGLYHGWLDGVSLVPGDGPRSASPATVGQSPDSGAQVVFLPWNDPAAVDAAFAQWGQDIAAVITEPVNVFGGTLAAPGFLAHLREVTTRHEAVLIFDEVVTGFRLQPGSAASLVGVTPDLATFAKGLGSGWPVSAVAGSAALFDGVATDRVRLSGTYNGNAAAMAAVIATVEATADGAVHRAMNRWGDGLRAALVDAAARQGVAFTAEGYPTAFWSVFDGLEPAESVERAERLCRLLWEERVITYHHTWLPSAAHDDEALAFTVEAFTRALAKL